MKPVFLLPDTEAESRPGPARPQAAHWMAHWSEAPGERAVLNWTDGASAAFRLYAALQGLPGARVVAEGRRIVGFAALCERHLDLSLSAALLVVTARTAPGLIAALERSGDTLWFAPFAFPALMVLGPGLGAPVQRRLETAARDWGARVLCLNPGEDPLPGRFWAAAPGLLASAANPPRRSAAPLRRAHA